MTIRRRLPKPHPVALEAQPDWKRLCRLVPGHYAIVPHRNGGRELFEILPPRVRFRRGN